MDKNKSVREGLGIGGAVRLLRSFRGMSQKALATSAGVSQPAICQIERGSTPKLNTVRRLSEALDVSAGSLIDMAEMGNSEILERLGGR